MESRRNVKYKQFVKKMLLVRPSEKMELLDAQLRACGIPITSEDYVLIKRICLSVVCILLTLWGAIFQQWMMIGWLNVFIIGFVVLAEKPAMDFLQKWRSRMIVQEVYVISNQLLYYSGSKMNLHGKLTRCLPYTRLLRQQLQLLIHEWYGDVDLAIRQFKQRVGTAEGVSFAETIDALRLNESEYYYDLLRERIQDYKEKMDLYEESKKESTSYILFIIAGIPLLNTFRVFIYPWVAEGQRLFHLLNG